MQRLLSRQPVSRQDAEKALVALSRLSGCTYTIDDVQIALTK
jgi:hypothetical protein